MRRLDYHTSLGSITDLPLRERCAPVRLAAFGVLGRSDSNDAVQLLPLLTAECAARPEGGVMTLRLTIHRSDGDLLGELGAGRDQQGEV